MISTLNLRKRRFIITIHKKVLKEIDDNFPSKNMLLIDFRQCSRKRWMSRSYVNSIMIQSCHGMVLYDTPWCFTQCETLSFCFNDTCSEQRFIIVVRSTTTIKVWRNIGIVRLQAFCPKTWLPGIDLLYPNIFYLPFWRHH